MVYLREPRYPWLFWNQEQLQERKVDWLDRAKAFQDKMYEEALRNDAKMKESNKMRWDKKKGTASTFGKFKKGDLIWYLNPIPGTGKFARTYLQAVFLEYLGSHTANIQIENGSQRQTTLDRIKRRSSWEDLPPMWDLQDKSRPGEIVRDNSNDKSDVPRISMERYNYKDAREDFNLKRKALKNEGYDDVAQKRSRESDDEICLDDLVKERLHSKKRKRPIQDPIEEDLSDPKLHILEQGVRKRSWQEPKDELLDEINEDNEESEEIFKEKRRKIDYLLPTMIALACSTSSSSWMRPHLEKISFSLHHLAKFYLS